MILTEHDALKRWCPFARVAFVGNGVMNRISTHYRQLARQGAERGDNRDQKYYDQQESDTHCIGSRCMAWRPAHHHPVQPAGYCGLAGAPVDSG